MITHYNINSGDHPTMEEASKAFFSEFEKIDDPTLDGVWFVRTPAPHKNKNGLFSIHFMLSYERPNE